MSKKTLVCIVSDQIAANLLPITYLHDQGQCNQVVLLATQKFEATAKRLKQALTQKQIHVSVQPIDAICTQSYKAMFDIVCQILIDHESDDQLALNVTGGTKIMAMAAYAAFNCDPQPVYYLDLMTNNLVQLSQEKDIQTPLPPNALQLESYLNCYGYQPSEKKPARRYPLNGLSSKACNAVATELFTNKQQFLSQLPAWNYELKKESDTTLSCRISPEKCHAIAQLFHDHELCDYDRDTVTFTNESAKTFATGGWLEYLIFEELKKIRTHDAKLVDIIPSLEVQHQNMSKGSDGSYNEIDVAVVYNNQLFIIECKTRNFKNNMHSEQIDTAASDAIYKLDSLKKLGGLKTQALLVTYKKLPQHEQQRASDHRIEVAELEKQSNLEMLRHTLHCWLKSQKI